MHLFPRYKFSSFFIYVYGGAQVTRFYRSVWVIRVALCHTEKKYLLLGNEYVQNEEIKTTHKAFPLHFPLFCSA